MPNDFAASQAPSYIIYRDVPAGELYDPTAPLAFFPPKDSDELFDALRAKYPHLKSHSERMRDATIEFLLEERQAESMSTTVSPAMPSLYDSMTDASPWQQSWPSASMTTLSSPEMTNFATPSFDDSPVPSLPSKQSSESQTSAIDQMTSVFSLSTSEQPKQRVRRKMTEAEKVEYRKRRIVKACDKCSKRKRKACTLDLSCGSTLANIEPVHPQPAGDSGRPERQRQISAQDHQASVCRILFKLLKMNQYMLTHKRANTAKSSQQIEISDALFGLQEADSSNLFGGDGLTGGYEDFTLMFDDPTLDFSLEDFMPFDQQQNFTPADNFRQCVQHFNADTSTSTRSTDRWEAWAPHNAASVDSSFTGLQGNSELERGHDVMISQGAEMPDSRRSRRRRDLAPTQSASASPSSSQSPSAGQLEGLMEAASPSSVSGTPANSSRPPHAHDSQTQSFSCQLRSGEIRGSTCEEDPGRSVDDGVPLRAHTNRAQRPEAAKTLPRSHESSQDASEQEVIRGRPAVQLRYRLRNAGTSDSALTSELSSTSATSSRSTSGLDSTAALEGRPSICGNGVNSSRMTNRGDAKDARSLAAATAPTLRSLMASPSSPTQGEGVSSGLPNGRRNATPSSAPATLPPLRTGVPSVLHARPSSLDDSMTLRSSEIFRLKHRIPASLDSSPPASLYTPSIPGLSTQANGGARDTAGNASTRPATWQQANEAGRASTLIVGTDSSKSTEANGMRKIFTESDTNREKDHHGRDLSSQATATQSTSTQWSAHIEQNVPRTTTAIVVLVATCLLAASLLRTPTLGFALCVPVLIGNLRQSKAFSAVLSIRSRTQGKMRKIGASSFPLGRTILQQAVCI